ncbi:MAG: hypothetical protein R6X20_10150, partial [Phycisphaerae bacterium]
MARRIPMRFGAPNTTTLSRPFARWVWAPTALETEYRFSLPFPPVAAVIWGHNCYLLSGDTIPISFIWGHNIIWYYLGTQYRFSLPSCYLGTQYRFLYLGTQYRFSLPFPPVAESAGHKPPVHWTLLSGDTIPIFSSLSSGC